jgi:membrane fusion protein (multidrug efflux system)
MISHYHLGYWLVAAALGVAPFALAACEKTAPAAVTVAPVPAPSVGIIAVARSDVPLVIEAVGMLDGYVNADIRARVRGFLRSQDYKDGEMVKQGQTLFTIDASEYVAGVESAKANLSRAMIAQSHANIEFARDVALVKSGSLSQQVLDTGRATLADADGQVRAAQAAVQQATLNLSYTNIRSPTGGVAGVAQVRVGNLVGQAEPTLLATVSETDPMRVTFPLSELEYLNSPERFQHLEKRDLAWARAESARLDRDPSAKSDAAVELILANGSVSLHRGVIVAVSRNVDTTTGTLLIEALVPNPELTLRPGQYGRVRMPRGQEGHDVLTVPEKALIAVQGTYSVAVVGRDNKVALKHVELGASASGQRVVMSGIKQGDRIVVEGTPRATDGALVDPHEVSIALAAPVSSATARAPSALTQQQ